MNNETILKEAIKVAVGIAKERWGDEPVKDCMWGSKDGTIYSKKEFAQDGIEVYPLEKRWYQELKKYLEQYL